MEYSGWAWLPDDLLEPILNNLASVVDSIRFGAVCTPWHSLAVKSFQRLPVNQRPHLQPPPLPWLMVLSKPNSKDSRSFYSITHQKLSKFHLPVPPGTRYCGSSHGWLITTDETNAVSLLHPFSRQVIRLPPLTRLKIPQRTVYGFEYHLHKGVLSANPTSNPDDFVLMVIYGHDKGLAFIKSGDQNWAYIDSMVMKDDVLDSPYFLDLSLFGFEDVIYQERELQFYALSYDSQVLAIKTSGIGNMVKVVPPYNFGFVPAFKLYLVESPEGRDLWQIEKVSFYDKSSGFKVFVMVDRETKPEWVEVNSLGDVALFLGDNDSIAVTASRFSGCRPSCIYVASTDDTLEMNMEDERESFRYRYKLCEFNVETGSYAEKWVLDNLDPSLGLIPSPVWIECLPIFN